MMVNNSTNELRRRKNNKDQHGRSAVVRKRNDTNISLQRPFFCAILSGSILLIFFVFYGDIISQISHQAVDHVIKQLGYHTPVHAVVIDAGSTGSRVLAFTFHESYLGGYLVLDKELFRYTKPGLSSFVDDPKNGVKTIDSLLQEAQNEIPTKYWTSTPLILKATAGLRLLPYTKAEQLLAFVKQFFTTTPFVTDHKSVEIMNGTDEGIYSWFTVNFLLNRIHGDPAGTVAALDLGGASTQVTFSAVTPASLTQTQYIHQAKLPSGHIPVYTHSYLGLGLKAARQAIITVNQSVVPTSSGGATVAVTSDCINHMVTDRKFHFGGIDYLVSGPPNNFPTHTVDAHQPIVDFERCTELISEYVGRKAQPQPEELPIKTIFAFSYYFDRAVEVGLIDPAIGGRVRVEDFRRVAQVSCENGDNVDGKPFQCLDLTYIWILLERGFGLDPATDIYLYKKIDGHEISWALGAAYNLLMG